MKLIEKICFPTDFGKSSEVALESVISIAKRFGSEVYLVHLLPETKIQDHVKTLIEEKMAKYEGLVEEQNISCSSQLLPGSHMDSILSFAERKKANLIILGPGHEEREKFKLGSNSLKIIRNSPIPVWVIEKESAGNPERVLCPIDFSEESLLALDSAIHLCRNFNAKLHILHVVKGIDKEYTELGADMSSYQSDILRKIEIEFDEQINELDLKGIAWDKEVILGDPVNVILDVIATRNIDLVMMGSTGKGALKRFFLGSHCRKSFSCGTLFFYYQ